MKNAHLPLRSSKTLLRSRYTWIAALAAVILGASLLLAQVLSVDEAVATFDQDLYKEYKSHEVKTLDELAQDFQWQQAIWLPIAPPSTEFWGWTQEASPLPLPFDPAGFPKVFVANLIPAYRDGVVVYPVTAWEEAKTRDRVFYNADGKEIGRVSAPQGYDPRWCLFDMRPNLATQPWTDAADWLALIYDPSHLMIRYDLILDDDLIKWVLAQSIRAALRVQQGNGGGMMMMQWQGGTVTNVQFVDIQKETNGCVTATLAYPEQYQTNANTAFEIFTSDGGRGLIDFWWDPGVTTNVNTSTNWIAWTDPGSSDSNVTVRFYAAAVSNDVDGDGFTDGLEKYVSHTDPTNANSHPVSVSGTISYTGSLTGPVRMIAVTDSNSWIGCMTTIASLGAYTNSKVANGTSHWFKAYRDCNYNKTKDYGEPWGIYSDSSTLVTSSLTGINITLTDHDEDGDGLIDWWEMLHFGNLDQGAGDDPDGDGLVNSNEYAYGTNPTVPDTDGDGMGDGAEVMNGNSPTAFTAYSSLPFTENFELFEVLDSTAPTNFGYSVSICSNRVIVGAYGVTNGSAWIYEWDGTNWQNVATLSAPAGATNFGISVGITVNRAVVGATKAGGSGRVYVLTRGQQGWTNDTVLAADDGVSDDDFGSSVAICGTNVVIGAMNAQSGKGKAYSFIYDGSVWNQTQCFNPPGLPSKAGFGCATAIEGERMVIGATGMNGGNWLMEWQSGRVYYFEQTGTNWTQQQTIYASDSFYTYGFGNTLDLSGDTLVVGSSMHDFDTNPWYGINNNYGAAYVFTFVSNQWTQAQRLESPYKETGDQFGNAVAVDGNTVAVGAFQDDSPARADCGAVYFYQYQQTNWSYQAAFPNKLLSDYDYFGGAVAMSQNSVIIGAHGDTDFGSKGSAFLLSVSNDVACFADTALRVDGKRGWTATPTNCATFSAECAQNGHMSMSLGRAGAKATHPIAACGMTNIWIDCYAKINPLQTPGHPSHPSVDEIGSGQAAFFAVNGDASLVAYDGSGGGAWVTATNLTVSATNFHRYTVKQDYPNKTWDLYFDGTNVFSNLGFSSASITEFSCFSYTGGWGAMSHVDSLSVGTTQPDFN